MLLVTPIVKSSLRYKQNKKTPFTPQAGTALKTVLQLCSYCVTKTGIPPPDLAYTVVLAFTDSLHFSRTEQI
jgi:hypothetical protein